MTWTLDNGTVVLQNFVMADEDCTEDRLEFWGKKYLDIVWNTTGTAECCYEDGCNDDRPSTTQLVTTASAESASTSVVISTTVEESSSSLTSPDPSFTTTIEENNDDDLDCDLCQDIQYSECINDEIGEFRIEGFGEMIKKMARVNTNVKCSCKTGFLPLYSDRFLVKCVDPIVKTSGIYGRCLVPAHCAGLTNSECLPDQELAGYPGFEEYRTCQCRGNTEAGEVGGEGLITECVPLEDITESACQNDFDCNPFGNAQCSNGPKPEPVNEDQEMNDTDLYINGSAYVVRTYVFCPKFLK